MFHIDRCECFVLLFLTLLVLMVQAVHWWAGNAIRQSLAAHVDSATAQLVLALLKPAPGKRPSAVEALQQPCLLQHLQQQIHSPAAHLVATPAADGTSTATSEAGGVAVVDSLCADPDAADGVQLAAGDIPAAALEAERAVAWHGPAMVEPGSDASAEAKTEADMNAASMLREAVGMEAVSNASAEAEVDIEADVEAASVREADTDMESASHAGESVETAAEPGAEVHMDALVEADYSADCAEEVTTSGDDYLNTAQCSREPPCWATAMLR